MSKSDCTTNQNSSEPPVYSVGETEIVDRARVIQAARILVRSIMADPSFQAEVQRRVASQRAVSPTGEGDGDEQP